VRPEGKQGSARGAANHADNHAGRAYHHRASRVRRT
jgi:hypothetical protein